MDMQRSAMEKLRAWKVSPRRKPLVLKGARQVGKTWLAKHFGIAHYKNVAYINFESQREAARIFEGDYRIPRILRELGLMLGMDITPQDTLIVLDEIQEAPRAVTSLKYFCEDAPEYHVIAAGSLLGVATLQGTGFPVGKVDSLTVHPLGFTEFLQANGKGGLAELLEAGEWNSIMTFASTFKDLLRTYYFVGGMPEAVATYAAGAGFESVREVQLNLLSSYYADFGKHVPAAELARVRMVWGSIASQLARENRKFLYGSLRKGARANDFEKAIQWLVDAGLIHLVYRISKPEKPLEAFRDSAFKMFMGDVGLLGAQAGLEVHSLLEGDRFFAQFKGALTEQYVLQQLLVAGGVRPFYWSADNSSAEVDFVLSLPQGIVPLEVKAEENLRSRSLASYAQRYAVPVAVRTSMSDYRVDSATTPVFSPNLPPHPYTLLNIPLYAAAQIPAVATPFAPGSDFPG